MDSLFFENESQLKCLEEMFDKGENLDTKMAEKIIFSLLQNIGPIPLPIYLYEDIVDEIEGMLLLPDQKEIELEMNISDLLAFWAALNIESDYDLLDTDISDPDYYQEMMEEGLKNEIISERELSIIGGLILSCYDLENPSVDFEKPFYRFNIKDEYIERFRYCEFFSTKERIEVRKIVKMALWNMELDGLNERATDLMLVKLIKERVDIEIVFDLIERLGTNVALLESDYKEEKANSARQKRLEKSSFETDQNQLLKEMLLAIEEMAPRTPEMESKALKAMLLSKAYFTHSNLENGCYEGTGINQSQMDEMMMLSEDANLLRVFFLIFYKLDNYIKYDFNKSEIWFRLKRDFEVFHPWFDMALDMDKLK